MGTWDLKTFRNKLAGVFTSRGIDSDRYDEWINSAKREVESMDQFEGHKVSTYFDTEAGERDYTLPARFLSVVSITDVTSGKVLIRTDIENIDMRSRTQTGAPVFWARSGDRLILDPTPDAAYEIEQVIVAESPDLVLATDTTDIPAYWDNAIFMLAVNYGMLELGQIDTAQVWFDRYLGYVRTRMTDNDWEGTSRSEPVRVVSNINDLRRR